MTHVQPQLYSSFDEAKYMSFCQALNFFRSYVALATSHEDNSSVCSVALLDSLNTVVRW